MGKVSAVIGQSGGPTAVINQSLVGVVEGLRKIKSIGKICGMRHGVSGLTKSPPQIVDLTRLSPAALKAIADTPSAALGSSRDKPDAEYCKRIFESCRAINAGYFFYIGGNDSSDTCRIVSELASGSGTPMRCFHVPKTVDCDLMESDHTPGYPSAARFVATAFLADDLDNRSLPGVKINIVMGRHAGFLTAAAACARQNEGDGPHLIYLPEVPFDTERFVADVTAVYHSLGRCQIAVSEGIQDSRGTAIATALLTAKGGGDTDAHGNVQLSGTGVLGDALADLVKSRVKRPDGKAARVRADTFGYLQRCWPDASKIDQKEARAAGRFAAALAAKGHTSGSVAIIRLKGKTYRSTMKHIELAQVAAKTRHLPASFIKGQSDVTPEFVRWCMPLIGKLPAKRVLP